MNIRTFNFSKDIALVTAIETKSHDEYWSQDELETILNEKSVNCVIVECENKGVGFLIYEIHLRRFTILRIGVAPHMRKKGMARFLLENLAAKLTSKRTLISAEVRERNLPVQLFMKAMGYQAVDILRDYYPDTHEDAFVFHFKSQSQE